MADTPDSGMLHVNGNQYNIDDLTYADRKQIKRIVKLELWDEEADGEWTGFDEAPYDDYMAATILVFLRRDDPNATLEQALACKPAEVEKDEEPAPPTKLAAKRSSPRSSRAAKVSATSGSQS